MHVRVLQQDKLTDAHREDWFLDAIAGAEGRVQDLDDSDHSCLVRLDGGAAEEL